MNKALIKKYKKEFDYWLEDGKLLLGYKCRYSSIEWMDLNEDDWDYCLTKIIIVINDEYTELRKAQAEGQQIQVFKTSNDQKWIDVDSILDAVPVELHRIKPMEKLK